MTTIPSLDAENAVALRHEFVCTGFAERVANWVRFLCLSFLLLQLLTSAANLLYPFAIDPPLFFNQLLFFLLACAAFETFAIPLEAIKDHCVIDLQKLMVVKVYYRYFFTRVVVFAPFDKISALGVSARPAPIFKGLFSDSANRYALLMLTENSELFRLTDYNLGLEEANELISGLQMNYLRNAQIVFGSENVELCVDELMSIRFVPKPCNRSILSLIDGLVLPAFQAGIGSVVVAILIAATALLGNFLSDQLFNTSLKIANQPVFQLLLATGIPDSIQSQLLAPPDSQPPAIEHAAAHAAHDDVATAAIVSPVVADVTVADVTVADVTSSVSEVLQVVTLPENTTSLTAASGVSTALQTADLVITTALEPPVPAESAPLLENIGTVLKGGSGTSEKPDSARPKGPEKIAARLVPAEPFLQKPVIMAPIPSRIPSLDETAFLSGRAQDADIKDSQTPVKIVIPAITAASGNETGIQKQASEIKLAIKKDKPMPVEEKTPTAKLPAPETSDPAETRKNPVSRPVKQHDSGKSVATYLGQRVKMALDTLGAPLTIVNSQHGNQLIYSGITMQTDAEGELIMQVNLTSGRSKLLGILATPEGISVGSPVREAKLRLGIPQEKADSPGLHFPENGMSIYPLPGDPEIIGSIKLYQTTSQKRN